MSRKPFWAMMTLVHLVAYAITQYEPFHVGLWGSCIMFTLIEIKEGE